MNDPSENSRSIQYYILHSVALILPYSVQSFGPIRQREKKNSCGEKRFCEISVEDEYRILFTRGPFS